MSSRASKRLGKQPELAGPATCGSESGWRGCTLWVDQRICQSLCPVPVSAPAGSRCSCCSVLAVAPQQRQPCPTARESRGLSPAHGAASAPLGTARSGRVMAALCYRLSVPNQLGFQATAASPLHFLLKHEGLDKTNNKTKRIKTVKQKWPK